MPMRIRTIKPEFWLHEGLCSCSDFSRLLAIALLNWADDEGYFMAHPSLIRGSLFPFLEDSKNIPRSLQDLSRVGWIELGKDDQGRPIGRVTNFLKHQRIDKPQGSKIKGSSVFLDDSKNDLGTILDDSKGEWKGMEGEKEHGKGTVNPKPSPPALDGFDEFWQAYPKKEGKEPARKSWARDKPELQTILNALAWQRKSQNWTKDAGQFIPLPATYLNAKRYNDERPAIARQQEGPPSCL